MRRILFRKGERVGSPCRLVLAELGLEAAVVRPRPALKQADVNCFVLPGRHERVHGI